MNIKKSQQLFESFSPSQQKRIVKLFEFETGYKILNEVGEISAQSPWYQRLLQWMGNKFTGWGTSANTGNATGNIGNVPISGGSAMEALNKYRNQPQSVSTSSNNYSNWTGFNGGGPSGENPGYVSPNTPNPITNINTYQAEEAARQKAQAAAQQRNRNPYFDYVPAVQTNYPTPEKTNIPEKAGIGAQAQLALNRKNPSQNPTTQTQPQTNTPTPQPTQPRIIPLSTRTTVTNYPKPPSQNTNQFKNQSPRVKQAQQNYLKNRPIGGSIK